MLAAPADGCCRAAGRIATLIGTALPSSSNFFINFIITQGVAMLPFRLMYPHIGVLVGLFRLLGICGAPPAHCPPPKLPQPSYCSCDT